MIETWPTYSGETVISTGLHQIVIPKEEVGVLATRLEQILKDKEYTEEKEEATK